jgi:hypothetical protein
VFPRRKESDGQDRSNHLADGDFPMPGEAGEQFLCLARYPKNIGWLDHLKRKGAAAGKCGDAIEVSQRVDRGTSAHHFQRDSLARSSGSAA